MAITGAECNQWGAYVSMQTDHIPFPLPTSGRERIPLTRRSESIASGVACR